MSVKNLNKFVTSFLSEQTGNENLSSVWMAAPVQKQVKSLFAQPIKKDLNAPKRGKSAYLFFCEAERSNIRAVFPDKPATQVTAELGRRWNLLKNNPAKARELEVYERQASDAKEAYETAKESYVQPPNTQSHKRVQKDGPKRVKSAYLFFCEKFREVVQREQPDLKATEVTTELGRRWNLMKNTNAVKEFNALALADKERYEREKEVWPNVQPAVVVSKQPVQKVVEPTPVQAPKKRSVVVPPEPVKEEVVEDQKKTNGFQLFSKENRLALKKNSDLKGADITKMLTANWKALSKDEKQVWNNRAASS